MARKKKLESDLRLVPCRVEPGMFRGEYLAVLEALNPTNPKERIRAQLFVDTRDVKGIQGVPERNQPVPGWLVVSLVRISNGLAQIVLPQPAQPFGENLLIEEAKVREEEAM
jgi:hypothetical protein